MPIEPITEEELIWLRKRKSDEEHAAWALRSIRRWLGYLIPSFAAAWAFYEWFLKHITFKVGS